MKNWEEILVNASKFIKFLENGNFYHTGYSNYSDVRVVKDVEIARDFATNSSFENFDEWETVSNSYDVFPESFEWSPKITAKLKNNNFFNFEEKSFNGAKEKWEFDESCLLIELMYRDIEIIFQCYANDYFPEIWKSILEAYLESGFPCGWEGKYPEGRLVVFSNK